MLGEDGDGEFGNLLLVVPVPVVDLEVVLSGWECLSVESSGIVEESVTDESGLSDLLTSWVSQVGIEEGVVWAGSWEVSWREGLDDDVELLAHWVVELEGEPLLGHLVVPLRVLLVSLVVGHVELIEVLVVVGEWHEERSIVSVVVASLLQEVSVPLAVVVTPWTLVPL